MNRTLRLYPMLLDLPDDNFKDYAVPAVPGDVDSSWGAFTTK